MVILLTASVLAGTTALLWRLFSGRFPWEAPPPTLPAAIRPDGPASPAVEPAQPSVIPPPAAGPASPPAVEPPLGPGPWTRLGGQLAARASPYLRALEQVGEELTDRFSACPRYHRLLGELALEADRPADAERAFKRAGQLAPNEPGGHIGLALVAIRKAELPGLPDQARTALLDQAGDLFTAVLVFDPWNVDALYNLGVVHTRRKRLVEAEQTYRKVLTTQPDHFRARHNLATIAKYYGRLGEARTMWEGVVAARPQAVDARYNLGLTCLELKLYDEAIEQFTAVREKQPGDADVWNNLGLAYQGKGDDAQALRHYRRAYEIAANKRLTADDVVILNNLADFHLTLHNRNILETDHLKEAILLWQQSLAIKPDQPRLKDLLRYFRPSAATSQPDTQPAR